MTTTHLPDQISLTPADADAPLYLERCSHVRAISSFWLIQSSMVVRGTVAGNNCLTEMILTFKVRDQSLRDPGSLYSKFANIMCRWRWMRI